MTVIGEVAMVTSIILDLIKLYKAKGIDVDLDTLEEKISDMNAQWKASVGKLKRP